MTDVATSNPYVGSRADAGWTTYHGWRDGELVRLRGGDPDPGDRARSVHAAVRAMVLEDDGYTCVAARSVLRRGHYRFGSYGPFGSRGSARELARDLWEFIEEFPLEQDRFATFLATFEPSPEQAHPDEEHAFEAGLWRQLQHLHDLDEYADWDPSVHADPLRQGFSFSFGGRAFFVVGMHEGSSRFARRTPEPTLVFNAHGQFEVLRDTGQMARMQQVNRQRDERKQGTTNPNLPRFEVDSETVMYSGRFVETTWQCPLHIRPPQQRPATEKGVGT